MPFFVLCCLGATPLTGLLSFLLVVGLTADFFTSLATFFVAPALAAVLPAPGLPAALLGPALAVALLDAALAVALLGPALALLASGLTPDLLASALAGAFLAPTLAVGFSAFLAAGLDVSPEVLGFAFLGSGFFLEESAK